MAPRFTIYFDHDEHPEDTLKAFEEFIKKFSLRYEAQFPDPPKVSLETAIQRWKVTSATADNLSPTPDVEQYDKITLEWKDRVKDKVKKLHSLYIDFMKIGVLPSLMKVYA